MSLGSSFHHGFVNGVTIKEIPILDLQGKNGNVFWVDSNTGSDATGYGTFKHPFASLAYAITQCTANNGDKIFLAEGHAENVASAGAIALNIAGVTIIFMGEGSSRATLTWTATAATMTITAASVTLVRPRFVTGIDAVVTAVVITGAYCKIIDGEWHDAASKAVTRAFVYDNATALGAEIHGLRFFDNTAGTQKQSFIKFVGVSDMVLKGISATGNYAVAPIENTAQAYDVELDGIFVRNTNTGPLPGMLINASTNGIAKNVDIRIHSGVTYVSSVAQINWDNNCLGYNADGHGGDPIGTAATAGEEGKIDDIEQVVGGTAGYDSSTTVPNPDGNLLERLEVVQAALASPQGDIFKVGTCDAGMAASATTIVCADLAGAGDDFYNDKYYLQVVLNKNSVGAAPETQIRQITNYVSSTGTFTTNAFGANVETTDKVAVIHESLVSGVNPVGTDVAAIKAVTDVLPDAGALTTMSGEVTAIKAVTDALPDAGALTTMGAVIAALPDAGALTTMSGEVTAIKAVTDALPDAGALTTMGAVIAALPDAGALTTMSGEVTAIKAVTDVLPDAGALTTMSGEVTAIKAVTDVLPDAGALTTMSGEVTAIKAVTDVLPDAGALTTIDTNTKKIDSGAISGTPTASSLATFIATGGTALGTALAASKSLIDAIGSNGSALAYGSGSALGAIGTSFWIKKTVTSSAILEASDVDITGVSSGGELAIDEVIVKTDGTGLATGTNFELKSNNAKGLENIFVETVANLGASKTVDLDTASVTGIKTVLESGAKLQVHSTVAACDGAGTIDIYVKFIRLSAGATVAAL